MRRLLLLLGFLAVAGTTDAQFIVDTISPVEVINKGEEPIRQFSSFTKRKVGGNAKSWMKKFEGDFFSPIALQVINPKDYKVRIDSIEIKSEHFDTNKVRFKMNLFYDNTLKQQSPILDVVRKGNIYRFKLTEPFIIPPDTSYISYAFSLKEQTDFFIYSNSDMEGFLYSYDPDKRVFKLIAPGDMPHLFAPQIKLYYTTIYDE